MGLSFPIFSLIAAFPIFFAVLVGLLVSTGHLIVGRGRAAAVILSAGLVLLLGDTILWLALDVLTSLNLFDARWIYEGPPITLLRVVSVALTLGGTALGLAAPFVGRPALEAT